MEPGFAVGVKMTKAFAAFGFTIHEKIAVIPSEESLLDFAGRAEKKE